MQIGELWVKIGGRDEALKATLSGVAGKLQSVGGQLTTLGGDLTKKITMPVVGVTAAVGSMVASFGWGRLKAMDAAEAQLKGLGYAIEDVERISGQVEKAVQGTTMTMAEGTSVAAGALAAGVKEGAELEKYIRQVGDAAVGSNRPIEDMAQIFNRVQGSGKLMTQELNSIEQGMPGFAMAMSNALGVSQAEFRKMVTEGKVSSEQFLDVMDSFAGEMSEAYANSWAGMVSNTKAWVGIIGETMLKGVFEQSKESVGEFMELLKSESVQEWAKQMGETIGEAVTQLVAKIKEAIDWFTGLDSSTQQLIGKAILFAVAIGPILSITGKIITGVSSIIDVTEKLIPVISTLGKALISLAANPVGAVIMAIAAAIAIGVLIYKNWDDIKEKAVEIGKAISEIWENLKTTIAGVWEAIKAKTEEVWDGIKNFLANWWPLLIALLTGPIGLMVALVIDNWDAIKKSTEETWTAVKEWLYNLWDGIKGQAGKAWESIYKTISDVWKKIKDGFKDMVESAKSWGRNLIQNFIDGIKEKYEALKAIVSDMAGMVSDFLGFSSPTKKGPGRYADQWAPNLVNMFAEGIKAAMPNLQASLTGMAMMMPAVMGAGINNTSNSVSTTTTSTNYFNINLAGGSTREQADNLLRELAKRGVRF